MGHWECCAVDSSSSLVGQLYMGNELPRRSSAVETVGGVLIWQSLNNPCVQCSPSCRGAVSNHGNRYRPGWAEARIGLRGLRVRSLRAGGALGGPAFGQSWGPSSCAASSISSSPCLKGKFTRKHRSRSSARQRTCAAGDCHKELCGGEALESCGFSRQSGPGGHRFLMELP